MLEPSRKGTISSIRYDCFKRGLLIQRLQKMAFLAMEREKAELAYLIIGKKIRRAWRVFHIEIPKGRKTIQEACNYVEKAEECFRNWNTKGVYAYCREIGALLNGTIKGKFGKNSFIYGERWGRTYGRFEHFQLLARNIILNTTIMLLEDTMKTLNKDTKLQEDLKIHCQEKISQN